MGLETVSFYSLGSLSFDPLQLHIVPGVEVGSTGVSRPRNITSPAQSLSPPHSCPVLYQALTQHLPGSFPHYWLFLLGPW